MGHDIAVDAESVYWSEADLGALRKVGLAGGVTTTLATASTITSFVLVPNGVMFVQNREQLAVVPRAGGAALVLGRTGVSEAVASDEANIYYACIPSGATNEGLCKLATRGGTPITLVSNATVAAIAVHGSEVFWIQENAIFKVSTAGGTPTMLLPASNMLAATIAADATHVYWIESTSRDLRRIARSGGEPELFSEDATANVIETDGSSVYWLAGFSIVAKLVTDTSRGSLIGTVPYVVSAAIDSKYIYVLQRDPTTNGIVKVERSLQP